MASYHLENSEKCLSRHRSELAEIKCRVGWRMRKVTVILNFKIFEQIKQTLKPIVPTHKNTEFSRTNIMILNWPKFVTVHY